MKLVDSMKIALAETFAFYLKAHYYHWNVEGPDFYQLHGFFSDLYEEVYGAVDKFAEEIRALNSYAPGSFKRFSELSSIEDEERIIDAKEMLSQLLKDNTTYIDTLTQTFKLAEEEKQIGLSNFIQDRIDQHQKHAWMIRSFLKGR